jgi:hypothetical protein
MGSEERFVDEGLDWLSGDEEFVAELKRQGLYDDFEDEGE